MTQVPPPGQVDCDLEQERVAQTPRTEPASRGRQTVSKRPVQSLSVAQVA